MCIKYYIAFSDKFKRESEKNSDFSVEMGSFSLFRTFRNVHITRSFGGAGGDLFAVGGNGLAAFAQVGFEPGRKLLRRADDDFASATAATPSAETERKRRRGLFPQGMEHEITGKSGKTRSCLTFSEAGVYL